MKRSTWLLMTAVFLISTSIASAEPKAVQSASRAGDYVSGEGEILIKRLQDEAKKAEAKKKKKEEPNYTELSKEDLKMEGKNKILEGTVSAVGSSGLAVEHPADGLKEGQAAEMWFNFVKDVKFNGFKKYLELEQGDTVSVVYKESLDGNKRILRGVTLVEKKPKEVEAPAEPEEPQQEPQGGSAS